MLRKIIIDDNGDVERIELVCTVGEALVIDKALYWLSINEKVSKEDRKLARVMWGNM